MNELMNRISLHGFAILKLLVWLVILATILAALYPVFFHQRDIDSARSYCMNNQRQLALGIIMSAQDHDALLPLPQDWVAATRLTKDRYDRLCFNCPENDAKGTPAKPDYGYNGHLYQVINSTILPLALGEVGDPSKIECTCDVRHPYHAPSGTTDLGLLAQQGKYTVSAFNNEADFRHGYGVIVSYLDGHTVYLGPGEYGHGTGQYNVPIGEKVEGGKR